MKKLKINWRVLVRLITMLFFFILVMLLFKINTSDGKNELEIIKEVSPLEDTDTESEIVTMRLEDNLTYKVYYGALDESIINDLILYNIVIIEPTHITDDELLKLQDAGVMVIGYQSLLEVGLWDGDILENLNTEDILIEQTEERGPTANPTSEHYKNLWIEVYEKRIVNRGFDGVFLDTVDHITLFEKEQRDSVIEGTVHFIEELSTKFPEMFIIQNRGFDVFFQGTASVLDGFMWENFDSTRIDEDVDYAELVKEVNDYSKLFGTRIMGLNRLHNEENVNFYTENKWLHDYVPYGTYSKYYFDNQKIDWIDKGIIDEEWILTKEKIFVEEGALDPSVLKKAQQIGIEMYLIMDVGEMDKQAVIENGLEDAIIIRKDDSNSKTYILNNSSNLYKQYFIAKIENAMDIGYDGIVIEGTKNWYDISTSDTPSRTEIYDGYTDLLKMIRDNFPEIQIYQYEGIMVVGSETALYLNGFVWTEFANSLYSDSEWQQLQIEQLRITAEAENWEVYIFSGNRPEEVSRYCIENGYFYIK